jgi:hypothetical protein
MSPIDKKGRKEEGKVEATVLRVGLQSSKITQKSGQDADAPLGLPLV